MRSKAVVFSIAFIAWSMRLLSRCRGHFGCAGKSLAYILRWLSPLHPQPLKICLCCWLRAHAKPETGTDRQLQHQCKVRRLYPTERVSYPPRPSTTLRTEERCLTSDCVSPVSADEITNEWRDEESFSDKERTEESLSSAVTSANADESTSEWRDLAYSSDRERTEDTAGQPD